jgi:hypothetical protein
MLRALPGQSCVRISDLAAHDTATWAMKSRRSRSLKIGPKRVLKRGMRARCRRPGVLRKSASPKAKADNAWIPGVSSGAALTIVVGGLLCLNFVRSFSTQCYLVLETEEWSFRYAQPQIVCTHTDAQNTVTKKRKTAVAFLGRPPIVPFLLCKTFVDLNRNVSLSASFRASLEPVHCRPSDPARCDERRR